MQCDQITTASGLAELMPEWNQLARGVSFRTFEWLDSWWRHYGSVKSHTMLRRELRIVTIRDAGKLVALAPWFLERSVTGGHVLKFLGCGETYSDYLSILAADGWEARAATLLARHLTGDVRGEWDALEVSGVDEEDQTTVCLMLELESRGHLVRRQPDLNCWRIYLPATWDEYLERLSKSHRKQIRRAERRLADAGSMHQWQAISPEEVSRAVSLLIELHQNRHRSLGRRGAFGSARFLAFQQEVIPRMAQAGMLRLDVLEIDQAAIAVEYQLSSMDVVYDYQSGLDPEFLELEPGRVSLAAAVRAAIEKRFRAFDLLRGDEPYKAHWRAERRPTLCARVVPQHRSAWLRDHLWVVKDRTRQWMKQTVLTLNDHPDHR